MKIMQKFDSVHSALQWFFNKGWIRRPADARSGDMLKIQCSPKADDAEKTVGAFFVIQNRLDKLHPKQVYVLQCEYFRMPHTQADVANFLGLAGDRSVREIRDRTVARLEKEFTEDGLLSEIDPIPIVYLQE